MTDQEFVEFVDAHPWTFAKTMPQWPHEWTTRDTCRSQDEFTRAVQHIRDAGFNKRWGGRIYRYLKSGDHVFWTMDPTSDPASWTVLMNRAVDA